MVIYKTKSEVRRRNERAGRGADWVYTDFRGGLFN